MGKGGTESEAEDKDASKKGGTESEAEDKDASKKGETESETEDKKALKKGDTESESPSNDTCVDKEHTGVVLHKLPASCAQLEKFCHKGNIASNIQAACPKTCGMCAE